MIKQIDDILTFWFEELDARQHWVKDASLDEDISRRFGALHEQARRGELASWRETAEGRLAEIIVLDQFSRNINRDMAESFANDELAVSLCLEAIEVGADGELPTEQKAFLYMPLMHSEQLEHHELALKVFAQAGLENNYEFEKKHLRIIERFGRYPHRNEILGRDSTPEERSFLTTPGSSF